jgi:nucleoside-diphosphate-sugar epimerase
MKILVVGGAGYIGGLVVDCLKDAGHTPIVYDALFYEETYRKPVEFVYGDIRDTDKLRPCLDRAEAVIWLAAIVGDKACDLDPALSAEINRDSVKWLIEHYDRRIVFFSTCSVYGSQVGVLNEESPVSPLSIYAQTKFEAERYLVDANALVFRLGTVYGVGDAYSRIRLDLVVNVLTMRAALEGRITVFGGNQFRPLIHVRDVAETVAKNISHTARGVYNLHFRNVRILDLAHQIRNHFPDLEIQTSEALFQDTRNYRVSSDKAKRDLGFMPRYSIDSGIEEVKELIEAHRIVDSNNARYNNQVWLTLSPFLAAKLNASGNGSERVGHASGNGSALERFT